MISPFTRRDFLRATAVAAAGMMFDARSTGAVQVQTMSGPMAQDAYRPVALRAKEGARPSMTAEQRDDLEHQIKCQCGCVLDIFTCRTTDFSCSVSPAMHSDVMALVDGGYEKQEIFDAFQTVYGEAVLMAPVKSGFNLLGYTMPFIVLAGGALLVGSVIRRMRRPPPEPVLAGTPQVDATPAELDQLDAAVRAER